VLHDLVYAIVSAALQPNCHSLQLNLTQAIEIFPGAPAQGPHRDHDMWWTPKGEIEYMINVMWALDDFTERNGATRIWPGSNHMDQSVPLLPDDHAISAVMPAGSACIFLGSTMHSGGENLSTLSRRGLIISYCLGWLKPWENQWLAYPPEIARTFDRKLAALVGYQQHLPSLGNFEGQCPSMLLGDLDRSKPFVDALLPQQAALAEQYREMRLSLLAAA
jgi:ectoine hydroxylase-related dioxygenase (phytanoyl-CoA dioxygenase family)